jgi:ketosteroid isomerase-like protein
MSLMPGCGRQSGRVDAAQTEKELRTLQDEWAVARIKGDVEFLERFYAQELRLQVMDGSVVERKDDIAMFDRIRRGDPDTIKPSYIKDVDMKVSAYCDTGVVTGVENLKGTYKGKYGEMALRFTNVFVRRDGRWQLVLTQSTPVQAK